MSAVLVSGVPGQLKLSKILAIFRSILRKHGAPSNFWIKEMEDIRGTYLKSMKMEFDSVTDAYDAAKILDGYKMAEAEHPLDASIDESRRRSPSPYRRRSRPSRDEIYSGRGDNGRRRYSPRRSRSPILRDASQLDIEIELLRKQRLIIEEERRLIMERKKLELVKELGPRAMRDYRHEDERRDRRYRPEREPRPRRPSPPRRPRQEPRPAGPIKERRKLPQFNLPCKILLSEMDASIEKYKSEIGDNADLLAKIMKNTLRKRIAVALEGKPIMPGSKIALLYREKYPKTSDDAFVLQHVKELKSLHMPGDGTTAKKAEVKEKDKQEKVNGKTESDTASQEDANTNEVKDENAENESAEEVNPEDLVTEDLTTEEFETEDLAAEEQASEEAEELIDEIINDEEKHEGSVTSSDALALHDINDEDWGQGEHDWTEETTQEE